MHLSSLPYFSFMSFLSFPICFLHRHKLESPKEIPTNNGFIMSLACVPSSSFFSSLPVPRGRSPRHRPQRRLAHASRPLQTARAAHSARFASLFLFVLTSQTTRCPFARSFSPRPSSSTRAATTEASRAMTAERRASRWSIRCRDTQGL